MVRQVECAKLKRKAEGLDTSPYPGELGQKIYANISKEAWQSWLARQTMFINEYRLNLTDKKARELLEVEMQKFLFEEDNKHPEDYIPPIQE